jgi:hypothetical protein
MSSVVVSGDTSGTITVSAPDVAGTNTITLPAETGTLSLDVSGSNKLINGGFGLNQRAVSGSVSLSSGDYGHDRFKGGASGCTYTFATSANVTTLTISAGSLIQVVEGVNLQSGTHTLSWTGTATAKIGGGSLSATGVTGTATGGTNLNIEISTGTVSLIQLEEGSVATPFEHRSYGEELALCQRFYWQYLNPTGVIAFAAGEYLANNFRSTIMHPVTMRGTPTVDSAFDSALDLVSPTSTLVGLYKNAAYRMSTTSHYIKCDAEL